MMQKFKLEYVGPTSGSFTTGKGNNQIEWPEEGSEMVILDPHERVCTLFCVGCDKPRGECSCGCVMTEWRPVEREE